MWKTRSPQYIEAFADNQSNFDSWALCQTPVTHAHATNNFMTASVSIYFNILKSLNEIMIFIGVYRHGQNRLSKKKNTSNLSKVYCGPSAVQFWLHSAPTDTSFALSGHSPLNQLSCCPESIHCIFFGLNRTNEQKPMQVVPHQRASVHRHGLVCSSTHLKNI